MKDRLNAYIHGLFADAERRSPADERLAELKEELLQNTAEKYDDLIAMGKSPEAAYRAAVDGIGDITELLDAVTSGASAPTEAVEPAKASSQGSETERDGNRDRDGSGENENKDDDDDGEDGGDPTRPPRSRWYALVSGIIWTVVLCAYFAVSFTTHAWNVTWLLFIMGIAADNVAKCIFDLRR